MEHENVDISSPEAVEGEQDTADARFFNLSGSTKVASKKDAIAQVQSPRIVEHQRPAVPPEPKFEFDEADYFYKMTHAHRGIALILNYEKFSSDRYDYASPRKGSSVDASNLVSTFRHLGFETRRFDNLRTSETLSVIRELALEDHSLHDCLVVAVMSHGDQAPGGETVFYTYDKTLRITDDLVSRFTGSRCESLRAKPKLFFVQACQGSKTDQGVYVQVPSNGHSNGNGHTNGNGSLSSYKMPRTVHLPDEADVMIAYSTPPGYYSWRNEVEGSWFITELCSSLGRWAFDLDIIQILTRVCYNVSVGYASRTTDPRMTNMKQCPTYVSRLTKQLKFPKPLKNTEI